MMNTLQYKGYSGSVEFSAEDGVLHGHVIDISDTLLYEGRSVKELTKMFRESVDDYLETCKEIGKKPEIPFKGSFNVRVKPNIHRLAVIRSNELRVSLNRFVESIIEKEVMKPVKAARR
jgi:predicted HicB family RNase H-like nuclease